jgi:hypothetical protein
MPFFLVYNDGQICLDILQNQWSPIYDISAVLTSIQVEPPLSIRGHALPMAPKMCMCVNLLLFRIASTVSSLRPKSSFAS